MSPRRRVRASLAVALALAPGCTIYRSFPPASGHVVDAESGAPLPDARVTACLIDLHPRAFPRDCTTTEKTRQVTTDASGAFHVPGSWGFAVFVPQPHQGFPGPFGTDLRVEREGYESQELQRRREPALSSGEDVRVRLQRSAGPPGCVE
jgi:hypothetical protein